MYFFIIVSTGCETWMQLVGCSWKSS